MAVNLSKHAYRRLKRRKIIPRSCSRKKAARYAERLMESASKVYARFRPDKPVCNIYVNEKNGVSILRRGKTIITCYKTRR